MRILNYIFSGLLIVTACQAENYIDQIKQFYADDAQNGPYLVTNRTDKGNQLWIAVDFHRMTRKFDTDPRTGKKFWYDPPEDAAYRLKIKKLSETATAQIKAEHQEFKPEYFEESLLSYRSLAILIASIVLCVLFKDPHKQAGDNLAKGLITAFFGFAILRLYETSHPLLSWPPTGNLAMITCISVILVYVWYEAIKNTFKIWKYHGIINKKAPDQAPATPPPKYLLPMPEREHEDLVFDERLMFRKENLWNKIKWPEKTIRISIAAYSFGFFMFILPGPFPNTNTGRALTVILWIISPIIPAIALAPLFATKLSKLMHKHLIDPMVYEDGDTRDIKSHTRQLNNISKLVHSGHHEAAIKICEDLQKNGEMSPKTAEMIEAYCIPAETKPPVEKQTETTIAQTQSVEELLQERRFGSAIDKLELEMEAEPHNYEKFMQYIEILTLHCNNQPTAKKAIGKARNSTRFSSEQIEHAYAQIVQWSSITK